MFSFGKDFTYTFTPYIDNEEVAGIPTHTAKLLVYSSQPARSQVIDETGELATYTATWATNAASCAFSVAAIEDPSPTSIDDNENYWVGIKFYLKSGGQVQIHIAALLLERPRGTQSALSVVVADLSAQFKNIADYCTNQEMLDQIEIQTEMLRAELEAKGFKWASIWRPDRLKRAIVYSTLGALLGNESKREGDQFDRHATKFDNQAAQYLKLIQLEYDTDNNNEPDSVVTSGGYAFLVR